jgi:hypothetical protein
MGKLLNIGSEVKLIKGLAVTLCALYLAMALLGSFLLPRANNFEGTNNAHHSKLITSSIAKIKRFMRKERLTVPNRKQFTMKVFVVYLLAFQFFIIDIVAQKQTAQRYKQLRLPGFSFLRLNCLRL